METLTLQGVDSNANFNIGIKVFKSQHLIIDLLLTAKCQLKTGIIEWIEGESKTTTSWGMY